MPNTLFELVKTADLTPLLKKSALELLTLDRKSTILSHITELLNWDQETYMPSASLESRAQQLAIIREITYNYETDPRVAEILHELGVNEENTLGDSSLPRPLRLFLRKKYSQWKKSVSVPPALIIQMTEESAIGHDAWIRARKNNDFSIFAPHLKKLIELAKNYAMCVGYEDHLYDALLDDYEPGCTTAKLTSLFSSLQKQLTPLYTRLCQKTHAHHNPLHADIKTQQAFCEYMAQSLRYNISTGRIDTSAHPFCVTTGYKDVRITTRYVESNPLSSIFSTLHELGHSFYELNIDSLYAYTSCNTGASFGVHESQSHFIESVIGRSLAFWRYWFPILQKHINSFASFSLDSFMKYLRIVSKNPIRTDADEVGYNLHIIMRFIIEKTLFEDEQAVDNILELWNTTSERILEIRPHDTKQGILQDVHWSQGAFGYFPSYALGTIYAAHLKTELKNDIPDYQTPLADGTIEHVLTWLASRVHSHGASALPHEIYPQCDVEAFIHYLKQRYDI